jgi:hypothetical protein
MAAEREKRTRKTRVKRCVTLVSPQPTFPERLRDTASVPGRLCSVADGIIPLAMARQT